VEGARSDDIGLGLQKEGIAEEVGVGVKDRAEHLNLRVERACTQHDRLLCLISQQEVCIDPCLITRLLDWWRRRVIGLFGRFTALGSEEQQEQTTAWSQ